MKVVDVLLTDIPGVFTSDSPMCRMQTYHSKAPKTVPACAILHAVPLHRIKPDMNTAKAMKPANQNIMVIASMARTANL